MRLIDSMLTELDQETQTARRLFERVPDGKLGWKPHAKSFTLGQLALHIAQIPPSVATMATQDSAEVPQFKQEEAASRRQLLETSEQGVAAARQALAAMDDAKIMESFSVTRNGQQLMAFPRLYLLRTFLLSQYIHHRGQLSVYLRLLDVPVPSIYGPSADENPFA